MTMKTYKGSCHCGAVRFEADIDFSEGTMRCNCSICWKARTWFVVVPPESARVLSGADAMTDYQWKAPSRSRSALHFRFCKTCGVRTVGLGDLGEAGKFCFVSIASLDDVDPDEITVGPIRYVDGRHDRMETPNDTRFM